MTSQEFNLMYKEGKVSKNKRVKNATKAVASDGTKCDSKLEASCYNAFKSAGIGFAFQERLTLVPGFRYENKAVRAITWTPDFTLGNGWIVDTKGYPSETFPLKLKLFKYFNQDKQPPVLILKNKKEVMLFVLLWKGKNFDEILKRFRK